MGSYWLAVRPHMGCGLNQCFSFRRACVPARRIVKFPSYDSGSQGCGLFTRLGKAAGSPAGWSIGLFWRLLRRPPMLTKMATIDDTDVADVEAGAGR